MRTRADEESIDALRREIYSVRELLETRITGVDNVLREKFTTVQGEVTSLRRELSEVKEIGTALSLRLTSQEQQKVGRGEAISNGQALIGLIIFLLLVANFVISLLR